MGRLGVPDFFLDLAVETAAPRVAGPCCGGAEGALALDFAPPFFDGGVGRSNFTVERFLVGLDGSPFWLGSVRFPKMDGYCVGSLPPVTPGGPMDWAAGLLAMAIGFLAIPGFLAATLGFLGLLVLLRVGGRESGYAVSCWPKISKVRMLQYSAMKNSSNVKRREDKSSHRSDSPGIEIPGHGNSAGVGRLCDVDEGLRQGNSYGWYMKERK